MMMGEHTCTMSCHSYFLDLAVAIEMAFRRLGWLVSEIDEWVVGYDGHYERINVLWVEFSAAGSLYNVQTVPLMSYRAYEDQELPIVRAVVQEAALLVADLKEGHE